MGCDGDDVDRDQVSGGALAQVGSAGSGLFLFGGRRAAGCGSQRDVALDQISNPGGGTLGTKLDLGVGMERPVGLEQRRQKLLRDGFRAADREVGRGVGRGRWLAAPAEQTGEEREAWKDEGEVHWASVVVPCSAARYS